MNIRQLVTASALYGIADVLVLGVGGFLLLPLYTRALSQADFGAYVAIRANTEILGYVIALGLLSAVTRLYFDHKAAGRGQAYIASILLLFFGVLAAAVIAVLLFGGPAWRLLSPQIPAQPYVWYSLGIAATTFTAGLGSLWLRLDNRVGAFVALQVAAALTLAVSAWVALAVLDLGLAGLLIAFVVGYLPSTAVLFYRLATAGRPALPSGALRASLTYGAPFAVSYAAYFILNRFSVLMLQHHVPIDEIAIFGLAQQLAVLVAVVSQSFGKAMQPAVFGADPGHAPEILRRSSNLFIVLVFGAAAFVVMFAQEIVSIVAPRSYGAGFHILLILVVASFIYSLGLVSNTALEFHRRPKTSAAISIIGAVMAVLFGVLMIPAYGSVGGAIATLLAYFIMTLVSHLAAFRLTRQSYFAKMALALAALCLLVASSMWPGWTTFPLVAALTLKSVLVWAAFSAIALICAPQRVRWIVALMRGWLQRT